VIRGKKAIDNSVGRTAVFSLSNLTMEITRNRLGHQKKLRQYLGDMAVNRFENRNRWHPHVLMFIHQLKEKRSRSCLLYMLWVRAGVCLLQMVEGMFVDVRAR
jgi:hypothetical protein